MRINYKTTKLFFLLLILVLSSRLLQALAPVMIITPNPTNASAGGWSYDISPYSCSGLPTMPLCSQSSNPRCWQVTFTDKADMYLKDNSSFCGNIATQVSSFPFGDTYPLDKLDTLQADVSIDILQRQMQSPNTDMLRYAVVMAVQRLNGPAVSGGSSSVTYTELDIWDSNAELAYGTKDPSNPDVLNVGTQSSSVNYKIDSLPTNQLKHYHIDFLPYINRTLKYLSGGQSTGVGIHPGDKLLWVYVDVESLNSRTTSEVLVANFSVTANGYCYILYKTINDSYGAACPSATWSSAADINNDGLINSHDLTGLALNSSNETWCHAQLNVNNPCRANLIQTVTLPPPSAPVNSPITPTFICNYSDVNGNPIIGATASVTVDSRGYTASYNPSTKDYRFNGASLGVGNHLWNCVASAPNFQPQTSPAQTYTINASTTLAIMVDPPSPYYIGESLNSIPSQDILFTADYNSTFGGVSSEIGTSEASVILYVDGTPYQAGFPSGLPYPSLEYYVTGISSLPRGTHTWYFTATAPGYQPQTSATQTYTVNCQPEACIGNSQCIYSGPKCAAACTPCPSGATCVNGNCLSKCPRGMACPVEEAPAMPVSNTWTFAVAILTIIGLLIGYFILKEAISVETTKTRKRRRK